MLYRVFLLLFTMTIYNQSQGQKLILKEFNKTEALEMNVPYGWSDGLTLKLSYFSHKEPFVGGPTKATAYLDFQKAGENGQITLSVHGVEGQTGETYDKLQWKDYDIELIAFNYDQSIQIKIKKEVSNNAGYFIDDKSVTKDAFEELKNSLTEVKGTSYHKKFKGGGVTTGFKASSKEGKIYQYKEISKGGSRVKLLEME